ncbi:hypothetical protein [Brasilonema bromeliae]|uniref:Transposase n=2 Tax=Bromeliae group (in: Brasilonema) TaxID=3398495 RepID=A0ABX1PBN6_9CYAN|nr:hypothetical protein [Brasilonema bromeliae SPC951]
MAISYSRKNYSLPARRILNLTNRQDAKDAKKIKKKIGNLARLMGVSSEMEGKTLKIIIVETDELEAKKERFFSLLDKHSFALPANYQFDREELHGK